MGSWRLPSTPRVFDRVRLGYPAVILLITILIMAVSNGLARYGHTLIVPSLRADLSLSYAMAGLLVTANFVGFLVSTIGGGLLAARFGTRRVSASGIALTALGMVGAGLAPSYAWLMVLQFVIGLGSGAYIPAMASVPLWFSARRRGIAGGAAVGGGGLGILLSGFAVPPILAVAGPAGWRATWIAFGLVTGLVALLTAIFLRNPPSVIRTARPVDGVSVWSVFRVPILWLGLLVTGGMGFSSIIYGTFFGAYGHDAVGLSTATTGRLWSLVGLLSLGSGLVWGAFSDRVGRSRGLAIVLALQGASFLLLAIWAAPAGLTVSAILIGLTLLGPQGIMVALIADNVSPRFVPAGAGLLTAGFASGQVVGPVFGGLLTDWTTTLAATFLLAAAASLAVAALATQLEGWAKRRSGRGAAAATTHR